jgi:sulfur transfer protein SufE
MSVRVSKPEHEVLYQELVALLRRHGDEMSAEEMLAIGANLLGKLLAYQDQRSMTRERGLEIIIKNIELGNQQAIDEVMHSKGSA